MDGPHQDNRSHVKWASNYEWLILEIFDLEDYPPEHQKGAAWKVLQRMFAQFTGEAILLAEQTTASVVVYTHFVQGEFARYLWSADGNSGALGNPEPWELDANAKLRTRTNDDDACIWPSCLDSEDIVSHFGLPSPWSDYAPQWECDMPAYDVRKSELRSARIKFDIQLQAAAMRLAADLEEKLGRHPTDEEWADQVKQLVRARIQENKHLFDLPPEPPPLPPVQGPI
jgi:thiamine pyrophosphate-dependent acetolactate synthase large subunit-like protein